jgi:hypothetical protein
MSPSPLISTGILRYVAKQRRSVSPMIIKFGTGMAMNADHAIRETKSSMPRQRTFAEETI